jgi:hypothetical protein
MLYMLYLLYLIYLAQELSVDSVRRIWRLCMHLQLLALATSVPLRQVLLGKQHASRPHASR